MKEEEMRESEPEGKTELKMNEIELGKLLNLSVSQLRSFTYRFHSFAPSLLNLSLERTVNKDSLLIRQIELYFLLHRYYLQLLVMRRK